jgi:hypothetical protein
MQKRYIEKLDMTLSPLGFGFMRLPMEDARFADEAYRMIDLAMEAGINYYDTAYIYQNGQSEEFVKDTLVCNFPRDSFHIADKLPVWECKNIDDMERIFQTQLERLGVEYIDLYLLHSLYMPSWQASYNQGVLDFLEQKKKEGKIIKAGFSLHDATDVLISIEKSYDWDFVQLQINYYDWSAINVDKSYEYLVTKEIPCIVMEPVGGGRLSKLPDSAENLLKTAAPDASVSSWAVRFAASLQNVAVTLSGMSTLDQVRDNISSFSPFIPMSDSEKRLLCEVTEILSTFNIVPCTYCRYCVSDCPKEIDIPMIFQKYNDSRVFGNVAQFKTYYLGPLFQDKRGDDCIDCGKCTAMCPQGIDIPKQLNEVHVSAMDYAIGMKTVELEQIFHNEPDSVLVCFCAGQLAKMLQLYLQQYGIKVSYFCDNSEHLWGTEINGVPVINIKGLSDITVNTKIYLFIAANSCSIIEKIRTQLESSNIHRENTVFLN